MRVKLSFQDSNGGLPLTSTPIRAGPSPFTAASNLNLGDKCSALPSQCWFWIPPHAINSIFELKKLILQTFFPYDEYITNTRVPYTTPHISLSPIPSPYSIQLLIDQFELPDHQPISLIHENDHIAAIVRQNAFQNFTRYDHATEENINVETESPRNVLGVQGYNSNLSRAGGSHLKIQKSTNPSEIHSKFCLKAPRLSADFEQSENQIINLNQPAHKKLKTQRDKISHVQKSAIISRTVFPRDEETDSNYFPGHSLSLHLPSSPPELEKPNEADLHINTSSTHSPNATPSEIITSNNCQTHGTPSTSSTHESLSFDDAVMNNLPTDFLPSDPTASVPQIDSSNFYPFPPNPEPWLKQLKPDHWIRYCLFYLEKGEPCLSEQRIAKFQSYLPDRKTLKIRQLIIGERYKTFIHSLQDLTDLAILLKPRLSGPYELSEAPHSNKNDSDTQILPSVGNNSNCPEFSIDNESLIGASNENGFSSKTKATLLESQLETANSGINCQNFELDKEECIKKFIEKVRKIPMNIIRAGITEDFILVHNLIGEVQLDSDFKPPQNMDDQFTIWPERPQFLPLEIEKLILDRIMKLRNSIRRQIDYYFSDKNFYTDNFLLSELDQEGWVNLSLISKFNRVNSSTKDIEFIKLSITHPMINNIEISPDCKKIRKKILKQS